MLIVYRFGSFLNKKIEVVRTSSSIGAIPAWEGELMPVSNSKSFKNKFFVYLLPIVAKFMMVQIHLYYPQMLSFHL